ncbi:MAG: lantibiotic dehydratase C-terminal domain-containing protein [Burkholderiales bacterium]
MWHSVHLTYYEPHKEALLLDAVFPALHEVCEELGVARRAYARRHWLFGPHIRINLDASADDFAENLWPRLEGRFARYVTAVPSRYHLDPIEYDRISRESGQAELTLGPYAPLRQDNSVCLAPYEARAELLGGTIMVEEMERYLAGTRALVWDLLRLTRGNESARRSMLFGCMILIAVLYADEGLRFGHLSFRSHAEAFLSTAAPSLREQHLRIRDRLLPSMVHLASRILESVRGGRYVGTDPFLRRWSHYHHESYQAYLLLSQQRSIPSHARLAQEYAGANGGFTFFQRTDLLPQTEFHANASVAMHRLAQAPAFDAYRLLLNFFYMNLPLFSVNAPTRYLLCLLVAEASEHILGESWRTILS